MGDRAYGVVVDDLDYIYISGTTGAGYGSINGDEQIYLAKFNTSGNKLWDYSYGTHDSSDKNDEAYSITVDSSNNVYVTGQTQGYLMGEDSSGMLDAFLSKFKVGPYR